MAVTLIVVRLVLAAVFGIAGVAKLADRAGFRRALGDFGIRPSLTGPVAVGLPVVEVGVAVALLLPGVAWWAALVAVALLVAFIGLIARSLARGDTPDCNCFGRLSAAAVGRKTLVRNGLLVLAGTGLLVAGPARVRSGALGWLGTLSAAQQVGVAAGAVIGALLASQGWLLVQLVRQNGRLLNRIDALERTVHPGPGHRPQLPLVRDGAGAHGHGGHGHEHGANGHQHGHQAGLPVGDPVPALVLPDLDGGLVELAAPRAVPTLLLFWSPTCGFCQRMLPDLKALEAGHDAGAPRLLVVSRGTAEENRALGLAAPVLLDDEFAAGQAFGANGTPQAVLIGPDGTVASPLAAGAVNVLNLANARLSTV